MLVSKPSLRAVHLVPQAWGLCRTLQNHSTRGKEADIYPLSPALLVECGLLTPSHSQSVWNRARSVGRDSPQAEAGIKWEEKLRR